jgi:hypothetical protein
MKTFSVLGLVGIIAGVSAFSVNFALGTTVLFATGFAAIVVSDYTRAARAFKLPATVALGARTEKFGLAA